MQGCTPCSGLHSRQVGEYNWGSNGKRQATAAWGAELRTGWQHKSLRLRPPSAASASMHDANIEARRGLQSATKGTESSYTRELRARAKNTWNYVLCCTGIGTQVGEPINSGMIQWRLVDSVGGCRRGKQEEGDEPKSKHQI